MWLQIGLLFDFPPLVGPATIALGLVVLVARVVAAELPLPDPGRGRPGLARLLVVAPLAAGLVVAALGVSLRGGVLWTVAFALLLLGRFVEGAAAVRVIRRVASYVRPVVAAVTPGGGGAGAGGGLLGRVRGHVGSAVGRLVEALVFRLVALAVVLAVTVATAWVATTLFGVRRYGLVLTLAVYLGTDTALIFVWDVRSVLDRLDLARWLGIVYCLAGAEVFNLPEGLLSVPFFRGLARVAAAPLPPGVAAGVPALDLVALVFGGLAYLAGAVLSVAIVLRG